MKLNNSLHNVEDAVLGLIENADLQQNNIDLSYIPYSANELREAVVALWKKSDDPGTHRGLRIIYQELNR